MKLAILMLVNYDLRCLAGVLCLLRWLEEWLDISQRTAERAMIVIYVGFFNLACSFGEHLVFRIAWTGVVSYILWAQHRRALRDEPITPFACVIRVGMQAIVLIPTVSAACTPPHRWRALALISAQAVYLVFLYATSSRSQGTRGRRRRLATGQLKQIFGELDWLPKPMLGEG